jgi:PAS domain S-box-containing protein
MARRRLSWLPFLRSGKAADVAQAHLAAIVDSSDDAIVSKDLNGIIQTWNAAAERIFGYTAAEVIGRPITVIIPPERHPEETGILQRLRRGERIEHFETIRVAKGGRQVAISLTVSPIRDSKGKVVGASKVARDVTERKHMEEALAEQREWFRTTLESIGDAVMATDVRSEIVFMNAAAESLTGWRREDAQGRPCDTVFHIVNEITRQPAKNPVHRVLKEGVVVGLGNHTLLVAADGTERAIDDSAAPIRHRDGRVVGVVLVFRDVAERRQVDIERRDAMAERGRLLESERAARAEAERANRIKDEFVAMVSHELRTPLNAMVGWTELLAADNTDAATRRRAADVLRRNTTLQAQLVSDLLDTSRMLSGKLQLQLESVDLAAVVQEAVQMSTDAAAAKDVRIRQEIDRAAGYAVGDPARLQQIVSNLMSNAIKFTPRGGEITLTLRQEGGQAEIAVADTGIGIAPEVLPLVFDRFRQADASTARRFGGLGLGLAIVKQLVEMHGGMVRAESAGEGRGARFTVSLPVPLTANVSGNRSMESTADAQAMSPSLSLQHVRVLVVEDDADTLELMQRILERHGAEVATARSAGEALASLANAKPDVLVSDVGLPEMDGYQLMERIRAMDPGNGGTMPAVAVTAFARPEDRTRALRAGFQAHVAKPVQPAELLATVASLAGLVDRHGRVPTSTQE